MEKGLQKFIQINKDSSLRWSEFKKESSPSIENYPLVNELIPFSGTKFFSQLTEQEKKNFFQAFMQFNAEAIILLELTLFVGIKSIFNKQQSTEIVEASKKMLVEEKDHTKAYIRFLRQYCPEYPKKSYLLRRNSFIKNSMAFFAKYFPLTLTIPGAKFEAYSVFYSQELTQHFSPDNYWRKLNHLHLLDETHHVGYEFDIYQLEMDSLSPVGKFFSIVATYFFILVMQFVFIIGSYRMVHFSKNNLSVLEKIKWTLGLGKWILRDFPAYQKTRTYIQKQFENRQPILGKYFKIIYR
jgi:hypothetical protein